MARRKHRRQPLVPPSVLSVPQHWSPDAPVEWLAVPLATDQLCNGRTFGPQSRQALLPASNMGELAERMNRGGTVGTRVDGVTVWVNVREW